MLEKWEDKKGKVKSILIVGGIAGLLLIPLIISFFPNVSASYRCSWCGGDGWVDPGDWGYQSSIDQEGGREGCFIATAAYGTETAKGLDNLRSFRDNILLTNALGESMVNAYYSTSPPIANSLSQHEFIRDATRISLVIPATIITGIIMNPLGLLGLISITIATILLGWKFGFLSTVSKGVSYATMTALAGIDSVLIMGWASGMWMEFSTIAIYILPIILPASIGIFIWTLKQNLRYDLKV